MPALAMAVATIFGATPTAESACALALQMDGDAEVISSIVTIQMVVSFFLLIAPDVGVHMALVMLT